MLSSKMPMVLSTMYKCRKNMVPCFIGAPGIGKTQAVQQFAEEKGAKMVTFILSTALPSEVSGIRMPDNDTKELEVFDDARMASLEDGDILFFDEILEAPPALWSACLTLIQDRMLASGRKLPDVMIVAASNPVTNPGIVPPSLRDRFQFILLEWDSHAWCEYINTKYGLNKSISDYGQLLEAISRCMSEPDRYGYNILTPRRIDKLIEYYEATNHEDARAVIVDMFDHFIADMIDSVCKKTPKQQAWAHAMDILASEYEIDFGDTGAFDITPRMLFDIIENLDEDKKAEVQEFLKGVEY